MGYHVDMHSLLQQIIDAIEESGESRYAISKGSGVAASQLSRLVRGQAGMSADNIDRVANYLGLEVVVRTKRRTPRR